MVSSSDPFDRDPALVERALRSHAKTQNALADFVRNRGLEPRSPKVSEPNFDLLWEDSHETVVVEVKSLSDTNEERQLRYGLGQVLRYRHLLLSDNQATRAALVTSRRTRDQSWESMLRDHAVTLAWPGAFDQLFNSRIPSTTDSEDSDTDGS
jgi:hypothetical protein